MLNADVAERLLEANPPEVGQVKGLLADIRQADQLAAGIIQHLGRLLKRRSQIGASVRNQSPSSAFQARM